MNVVNKKVAIRVPSVVNGRGDKQRETIGFRISRRGRSRATYAAEISDRAVWPFTSRSV